MQVLEVDAQLAKALQQRSDSGFLGLRIEGLDQRMAFVGQFQRKRGQFVGKALQRSL